MVDALSEALEEGQAEKRGDAVASTVTELTAVCEGTGVAVMEVLPVEHAVVDWERDTLELEERVGE